jgi:hypothetical protein
MKTRLTKYCLGLFLLGLGSFSLSGCSFVQGGPVQDEDKNIVSIKVDENTIPSTVYVGEFDNANIQLVVDYSDGTSENVHLTESLIPQKYQSYLDNPGEFTITIFYRGVLVSVPLKIDFRYFTVDFYAMVKSSSLEKISTQSVKKGEAAVVPDSVKSSVAYDHTLYTFNSWDTSFSNVISDLKVSANYLTDAINWVSFYRSDDSLIKKEYVKFGENAVAPTAEESALPGYVLSGWDKTFDNVTEDLDVHGVYSAVTDYSSKAALDCYRITSHSFGWPVDDTISTNSLVTESYNGGLRITGVNNAPSVTVIPGKINGLEVTAIAAYAFKGNTSIQEMYIPSTIVEIGERAIENTKMTCYIQAKNQPIGWGGLTDTGWEPLWNPSSRPVVWGYVGHGIASNNTIYYGLGDTGSGTEATITGHRESNISVGIASYLDGYPVTTIGGHSFDAAQNNGDKLTAVAIPNTVKKIMGGAFEGDALTSVVLPKNLQFLGGYAFYSCSNLSYAIVPSSCASIGWRAFTGCSKLTIYAESDSQPSNWDTWNPYFEGTFNGSNRPLFFGCGKEWHYEGDDIATGGTSVTALNGCQYQLNSAGTAYTLIGVGTDIASLNIASNIDGVPVKSIGIGAVAFHYSLSSIVFTEQISKIGSLAFYGNGSLSSATAPLSLTSLGAQAFAHCMSMTSFKFQTVNPPVIGADEFGFTWDSSSFKILVPSAGLSAYQSISAQAWQDCGRKCLVSY